MATYNNQKSVLLSDDQWDEMKRAVEEGEFSNDATYLRAMIEAGKSDISDMDPRTSDTETQQSQTTHGSTTEAVSDTVLIDSLATGKDNRQAIGDVLEQPTNKFENQLANRLDQLAEEPSSPVKSTRDPELRYWVEGDG